MKETIAQRNTAQNARKVAYDTGYIRGYDGTRPTDANTALSGNTKLCELQFSATAFGSSSGGVLTANAITQDSSAAASGTMTFVRCFASDGTTVLGDFSVGVGTGECQFDALTIGAGAVVQISAFTITAPVGT